LIVLTKDPTHNHNKLRMPPSREKSDALHMPINNPISQHTFNMSKDEDEKGASRHRTTPTDLPSTVGVAVSNATPDVIEQNDTSDAEKRGGSTPKRSKTSDTIATPVRHSAGIIPSPMRAIIGRMIPESSIPYYSGIEESSDGDGVQYIIFNQVEKLDVAVDSGQVLKFVDPNGNAPNFTMTKGRANCFHDLISHKLPRHIAISFEVASAVTTLSRRNAETKANTI
jgi:hypothetical protein